MEEQQPIPASDMSPEALAKEDALADEYLAGWKRAMADYANLKKESERAQGELAKYAAAGLVSQLLPIVDSFRKAMQQMPAVEEGQPVDAVAVRGWMGGVAAMHAQFRSAMKAAGVSSIETAEVPFDPALHEAMMMEKHVKAAPGTVIKVLEPGYKMHDRVLRPAKVIVAE